MMRETKIESRKPPRGIDRQSCILMARKPGFRILGSGASGVVKEIEHFLDVIRGLAGQVRASGRTLMLMRCGANPARFVDKIEYLLAWDRPVYFTVLLGNLR